MSQADAPAGEGRRALPAVDQVLNAPELAHWRAALPHELVVGAVREALAAARARIIGGAVPPDLSGLAAAAAARLEAAIAPSLRPAINAGGVIIQTNLGRAPLSQAARTAMAAAAGYSNLEYDLE